MIPTGNLPTRVGAFFDLDGTLLPRPSLERRFVSYLRASGAIGIAAAARWFGRFAWRLFAWNRAGLEERWIAATDGNKAHLAGVESTSAGSVFAALALEPLEFFTGAMRRLAWHVLQDHLIYLVTGSLAPLAVGVAWKLSLRIADLAGGKRPVIQVCATKLEEGGGRWTGEVEGRAVSGAAKARMVEKIAREHVIDLQQSYAYGDRWSDRLMLSMVGHPAAVNPSAALEWLARCRGWPVLNWMGKEERVQHRGHGQEREEKGHREETVLAKLETQHKPNSGAARAGRAR